jgi:hypothetical protein
MTEHFVTLFDSLFIPQGMALHMSMERHLKNYTLWVICVDDVVYEILMRLQLKNVRPLQLKEYETEELLRVKRERTIGEYCWTLTPFAPSFVFSEDASIARVTYLDSDVWFLDKPSVAFDELGSGKSVLITKHAYYPEYDFSDSAGIYCVQFMTFVRGSSSPVLDWWQKRCIEWCYAKYEDGKFGDQLYLNKWDELFPEQVHILSYGGYTLAPWNIQRYPYSDAFLYHFQGLRLLKNNKVLLAPPLAMIEPVIKRIYNPYLLDISQSIKLLSKLNFIPRPQRSNVTLKEFAISIAREIKRIINKLGRIRVVKLD